jgi:hypothetical protein
LLSLSVIWQPGLPMSFCTSEESVSKAAPQCARFLPSLGRVAGQLHPMTLE